MLTTAGKTEVANLFTNQNTPVNFGWIAIGVGTTAAAIGDTTLEDESNRVAATIDYISILSPLDTIRFVGFHTIDKAETISEIGVLNAVTAGDLLARRILNPTFTVAVSDKGISVFTFTIKDGGAGGGSGW